MWGIVIALLVTFLVSGIWHGAALTVICWGLMQGVLLSIESVFQNKRNNFEERFKLKNNGLYTFICCVIVYLIFAFTEIYGMSSSFEDANLIVKKIFTDAGPLFTDEISFILGFASLFILFVKDLKDEYNLWFNFFYSKHAAVRIFSIIFVTVYILLFGVLNGGQFIYFQF